MTAWGFADCQRDAGAPGYGSTLGRLFMRALPDCFKADSTYTWFPLMTPDAMKIVLEHQGDAGKYDLSRPGLKTGVEGQVVLEGYGEVAQVLGSDRFGGDVSKRAGKVVEGHGYVYISASSLLSAERLLTRRLSLQILHLI